MKPTQPLGELLTKEQLRERLNLPTVSSVEQMMRKRSVPYLVFGHRTVRFDWQKVERALARFEVQEVGVSS